MAACSTGCGGCTLNGKGAGTMHQTTIPLYVFAGPSTKSKILGVVPKGSLLSHIGLEANGFVAVRDARTRRGGFIARQYLESAGKVSHGAPFGFSRGGGDAGALSTVPFKGAGFYESTGDTVAVRSAPQVTDPWSGNVKGVLNIGDVVEASGKTVVSGPNTFAEVGSVFGPGWVAVQFLQPSAKTKVSGGAPVPGGGGAGPAPADVPPADQTTLAEGSVLKSKWALAGGLLLLAVAIYFVAK